MNSVIIGGLVSWIVNVSIGIFVYFNNPKRKINQYFFLLNLSIGCWSFGSFLLNVIPDDPAGLWLLRLSYIFSLLIIPVFINLVFALIEKKLPVMIKRAVYFPAAVLLFFLPSSLYIKGVRVMADDLLISVPGPVYYVFFLYFIAGAGYGFYKLVSAVKEARGLNKNRLKYITLSYIIALLAGIDYFLSVFKIFNHFPLDDYILVFSFIILAYAILKYRLLDIRIAFSRIGLILVMYSLSVSIPFYVGEITGKWEMATILVIILVIPLTLLYQHFRDRAENFLFKKQRQYQQILVSISKKILRFKDKDKLIREVMSILYHNVTPVFLGLYLQDHGRFNLKVRIPENIPIPEFFYKELYLINELEMHKGILIDFTLGDLQIPLVMSIKQDEEIRGFVFFGEKKNKEIYFHEDILTFNTLLEQFSLALENIANIEQVVKEKTEKDNLIEEIEMAKQIQQSLLPAAYIDNIAGIRVAGTLLPARKVSGDYFDYIFYPSRKLGIVVADVTGKGLDSGMIMSMLKGSLYSLTKLNLPPRDLIINLNDNFFEQLKQQKFISLLYLEYLFDEQKLIWTGAGHEHLLIYTKPVGRSRQPGINVIETGGIMLGVMKDVSTMVKQEEYLIQKGDKIIIYTDGIINARNRSNERFSMEGFINILEKAPGDYNARELLEYIKINIQEYIQDTPQYDDITMVILEKE